jgi:flagellar biosynthesis protein FlhF
MQLRTFHAKNMKEALASVRADMGPDAVIIASEKAKGGGVIVRAAIELTEKEPEPAAVAEPMPVADFDAHCRDGLLRRLRRADEETTRASFSRSELFAALNRHRVPDQLAHALAETAAKAQLTDMTLALAFALEKRLKIQPLDIGAATALLLVGPNGAGKTAVAAKIAAHARLEGRRTTLIASDSGGAGAVARLETFARHLDCALAVADSAAQINALVSECVAKKTFAIVDTAGFDPRNSKARTAFSALAQIAKLETLGVVAALNDAEDLAEIAEALAALGASRLIVTQVDLARRAGGLIAAATQALPLAHITRTPFIAGDLERPSSLSLARLLLDEQRSAR